MKLLSDEACEVETVKFTAVLQYLFLFMFTSFFLSNMCMGLILNY